MHRKTQMVLALIQLTAASPQAAGAQLTLSAGAHDGEPRAIVNRALLAAALKPVLTIRLVSNWPQLTAADGSCLNGGQETLSGTLELGSGGNYLGTLRRQAEIRFCGTHGAARDGCALTLTSVGPVSARGEVRPFTAGWTNPVLELRWATVPNESEVHIEGNCTPAFNEALHRLYLGVTHAIEFQVPVAGEERLSDRLEDYGWLVDVR